MALMKLLKSILTSVCTRSLKRKQSFKYNPLQLSKCVLNPVIMVENICTLILAVHTILPHFKGNLLLGVILVVSPYTSKNFSAIPK